MPRKEGDSVSSNQLLYDTESEVPPEACTGSADLHDVATNGELPYLQSTTVMWGTCHPETPTRHHRHTTGSHFKTEY